MLKKKIMIFKDSNEGTIIFKRFLETTQGFFSCSTLCKRCTSIDKNGNRYRNCQGLEYATCRYVNYNVKNVIYII